MVIKKRIISAIANSFPGSKVKSIYKFKKGHVNETYKVKLLKGNLILRIYGMDGWKAVKEKYVYDMMRAKKLKVPFVYNLDSSKKIINKTYSILSFIQGNELKKEYLKNKNNNLIKEAGHYLKTLHSIKFKHFGWIIGEDINPKFNRWNDFVFYDLENKFKNTRLLAKSIHKIKKIFEEHENLLKIQEKPCLVHKDFHSSHIIAQKNKINGAIDVEWAIAGHNELDFVKLDMWFLNKYPELKPIFYKAYGKLSKHYEQRKLLYELLVSIGLLSFANEMNDKRRRDYSLNLINKLIKNEYG